MGVWGNSIQQGEDARKIVWGCLFLSRGKQAQVSQKPALSKFSEPPRNAHFLVSMPGISRFLDDFTLAAEPLPASPPPQRGEAPPTSRISRLAPSFCFLQFSFHLCPKTQTLPSSFLLVSLLWDKMGDVGDTKLTSFCSVQE